MRSVLVLWRGDARNNKSQAGKRIYKVSLFTNTKIKPNILIEIRKYLLPNTLTGVIT